VKPSEISPLKIVAFIVDYSNDPVPEKIIRERFDTDRETIKELVNRMSREGILVVKKKGRQKMFSLPPVSEQKELSVFFNNLVTLEEEWRERFSDEESSGITSPVTESSGSISRFLDHMVFLEETASIILTSLEKLDFSKVFLESFKRLFSAVDYDIGIALTVGAELKVYLLSRTGVSPEVKREAIRSARELMNLVVALPFVPTEFSIELDLEEMEPCRGKAIVDRIGVSFERDRMTPGLLALFRLSDSPFLADEKQVLDVLSSQISLACININAMEKIHQQAVTDELTGISNKRDFRQRFVSEFERAKRYSYPLSLCMMDLDYFKAINDRYGHQQGDVVLSEVAALILRTVKVRVSDIVARYGGEEFVLLLPHTGIDRAREVAEKIRASIEGFDFPGEAASIRCSISIGVASLSMGDHGPDELLARADRLLYQAKARGRNLVISE